MKKNKRIHSPGLKAKIAMTALRGKYSVKEIASHFDVNPSLVHTWRQLLVNCAGELFSHAKENAGAERFPEKALDRKLKELKAEQEWMCRVLSARSLKERRECVEAGIDEVSILGQARLLGLHRSGVYYKSVRGKKDSSAESECLEADIQEGTDRVEPREKIHETTRSL